MNVKFEILWWKKEKRKW